jgi:TetR/AcrR family transcriptional regulator of autoinduction and epiphytic fitness
MSREIPEYHRTLSAANRAAILESATPLFLESGYDRTSLARVAAAAGVSTATLFKQVPTKAELFEATVLAAGGNPEGDVEVPAVDDLLAGLLSLGLGYAEILRRPRIQALMRTVIAESPRFPELRERTFDFGTLPVLAALRRFLETATASGRAHVDDPETASAQFLGMIATVVFWPHLVHGDWSLDDEQVEHTVREAAATIAARYGGEPPE